MGISTETNYMLQKTGMGSEGIEFKAVRVSGECRASLYRNDSAGGPPQVMVRPTAYTLPCCQGIPRGGTEKAEGGLATLSCPPQMSTFQADPPHILGMPRRGVAVCSVAPNLPSSMSPNPSERSPIRKPPWEEDEEDEDEDNIMEHRVQALEWEDRGYLANRGEAYRTDGNGVAHTHSSQIKRRLTELQPERFQRDSITPHGQLNGSLCVDEIIHMHPGLHS